MRRDVWRLNLANFLNAHAHYRDLQEIQDSITNILLIGIGTGLEVNVLRDVGYNVLTFDHDKTKKPDYCGDVRNLDKFGFKSYDCVIASHVLEHMSAWYLPRMLDTIAGMTRYALIYLPVMGKQLRWRVHRWQGVIDLPGRRKDPEHCWEIGYGFTRLGLKRLMEEHFTVLKHYRNQDWPASYNFVLQTKEVR
jgi:hypothetical protein